MRGNLGQRAQAFRFVGKRGNALRLERAGHCVLPRRHGHRLARGDGELRGVARKRFHVIAGTRHRDIDEKQVCRRVLGDHRQDVAEQIAVGQQCGGDVNRVGGRGKAGQPGGKLALSGWRQTGQRQTQFF